MGAPYSATTVSNYNVNPPPDDGSQSPSNLITWANTKTKIGDPLNTAFTTSETNTVAAFGKVIGGAAFVNTAVNYTVLSGDQGKEIRGTASGITITTPDCTVVGSPFMFAVQNASTGTITVAGNNPGVQQNVDGSASIVVQPGCGAFINTDGTNWFTVGSNLVRPFPPQAAFKNLVIKVASNTTVGFSADYVVVTDGSGNFQTLAFNLTGGSAINLGTTGAGALDTGTIAIDTWYAIWAIAKPDGTASAIASASFTSPTMPSGYTQKARVGAVQTIHASATLWGTWQFGRKARYVVGLAQTTTLPNLQTSPNTQWTAISVTRAVPTATASSITVQFSAISLSGGVSNFDIAPNTSYTFSQAPVNFQVPASGSLGGSADILLESTNIYYGWAGITSTMSLNCYGWEDNI